MAIKRIRGDRKPTRSVSFITIAALCGFFYLIGAWRRSGSGKGDSIALEIMKSAENCNLLSKLEFKIHHGEEFGRANDSRFQVKYFNPCDEKYVDYIDSSKEDKLHCLVPAPKGYVAPFRWPKSRDYVPYVNVPYRSLTAGRGARGWVRFEGDVFVFPRNGADAYIEQLASVIPMDDGSVRTALDIGCGEASLGAYLFEKNVITMSFAPRDSREARVKFAVERGVPAIVGALGTMKLPYPSRAFDIVHCSHCSIQWGENDGMYMMEVDRVLRPGGYWILSGPPVNWRADNRFGKHSREKLEGKKGKIEEIAELLCWEKSHEMGEIAIWRKRTNNKGCTKRNNRATMCNPSYAHNVWYKQMEPCVTPYHETSSSDEVSGVELKPFPERLNAVPPLVAGGYIPEVSAEVFLEDTRKWQKHLDAYKRVNKIISSGRYRNIMDMNAGLGSFASALESPKLWVMNIIPTIAEKDTLGAIYQRGLIGIYHDWCEAFSTYPRSYDLIHANGVFTLYKTKCKAEDILLEMDRILRPEGAVIFRDHVDVLIRVKRIASGMRWNVKMLDHEDGPLLTEKVLFAVKQYWVSEESA